MKTTAKLLLFSVLFIQINSCEAKGKNVTGEKGEVTAQQKLNVKEYTLPGATVLAFGSNNVLFVGDSKSATIHAISTKATELKDPTPYNYWGVDKKIAEKLGISTSDLIISDMKVNPVSQEAYIAVKRGHHPDAKALIAIVSPQDGSISFLNVSKAKYTKVSVLAPVTETPNFWRDIPASSLNITDMDFHKGKLYVSGLTNGEFASTLRIIDYPFEGKQTKVGRIEMYHAVHTQNETRAPIRSMLFEDIDRQSTLIASYTCTPLVTIPTSEIKEDNHIKAKTIAELGYGNIPIDMITFMAQEQDGSFDKKLLITNKYRSGSLISLKDLAEANRGDGLSGFTQGPEGVKIFPVPLAGVMHIDEQNQMMLTILRRNIESGRVDIFSELKGAYFRLSDFINEYDFADYEYTEGGKIWKDFHNMIKPLEGFPEMVSDEK
jgi:hypothetical protein